MPTLSEKLAQSLEILKELQDKGITAIKSEMLTRTHKDRLLKNGFIREVTKGWYIATPADELPGDSTSWYASYWHFCADYLTQRYGDSYFISPDQSLQIHAGNRTVPNQLIIRTTKKANHGTPLPFETSLWHWESPEPKAAEFVIFDGIRMMTLPSSLIYCTPTIFTKNPTDVRTALSLIRDSSEILRPLLEGGHSTIAGRLAGAFKNIGKEKIANDILNTMQYPDYDVRETDPFETASPVIFSAREQSPYVNRIKLMWFQMRETILKHFPTAPGLAADHEKYMKQLDEIYVTDAYHSLSIERYKVTPELIKQVRSGTWDTNSNEEDRKQKDAMAARGYWLASQQVRESIREILNGKNPGAVADDDHGVWYRELFGPSITAGILKASDLAGYRNTQVYISGSKHVPQNQNAVRDAMPTLFELLRNEPEASVRAVLGHFIFVFIHPYMDGNGRMGRFLMNIMLASGGYPWTVIPVEERKTYMTALEKASVEMDITLFAEFIGYLVEEGLKGTPVAKIRN
ncbi:MAG: Fic family protein [Bacteroidetes bacterium]|nr:Fic family protein [Bacteroidota bacterium]